MLNNIKRLVVCRSLRPYGAQFAHLGQTDQYRFTELFMQVCGNNTGKFSFLDSHGKCEMHLSEKGVSFAGEEGTLIPYGEIADAFLQRELKKEKEKEKKSEVDASDFFDFTDLFEQNAGVAREVKHDLTLEKPIAFGGSKKERIGRILRAIRTLKTVQREKRLASVEEQGIMSAYCGLGGLPDLFEKEQFSSELAELRSLLNEEEFASVRASVTTAFYTPPELIQCIWAKLRDFGFAGGSVLEPGMGVGNFFTYAPTGLPLRKFGVELDAVSGGIAKQLHQTAEIYIDSFQNVFENRDFFDVVVGNVPFGDVRIFDSAYRGTSMKIHDYFMIKAVDLLRPGGIMALITSKGVMDKRDTKARKYLCERAELLGAVRLPSGVFSEDAGTEVTSDVLFFQKRDRRALTEDSWVSIGETGSGVPVNNYFLEHPEHCLGEMKFDSRFGGNSYTYCEGKDFSYEKLAQAMADITGTIPEPVIDTELEESETIPAMASVRNFTHVCEGNMIYYRTNSVMVKKKLSDKQKLNMLGLIELRDLLRQFLILQQRGMENEEFADWLSTLNRRYDSFVAKHGYVNSVTNLRLFADDADAPLLSSIEVAVEDSKDFAKAGIFFSRTVKPECVHSKSVNAVDCLRVCIAEMGKIDRGYLESLYDGEVSELYQRLVSQKLIFRDPAQVGEDAFSGYVTADQYLSGNVRVKLEQARDAGFMENVAALEEALPKTIPFEEIDFRIGAPWIDASDYQKFIYDTFDTPHWMREENGDGRNAVTVKYHEALGEWIVESMNHMNYGTLSTTTYGTSSMNAYVIFEHLLNQKELVVKEKNSSDKYVTNQKKTIEVRSKAALMEEAFVRWLTASEERKEKYELLYNKRFNSLRLREYDGSCLSFPGMNPSIQLKEHQQNAVARILFGGNTLLAHTVGAGKSFVMDTAIMELRRLSQAQKPLMVVPKAIVSQTAAEFLRLYPAAKILVASERDFGDKNRRKRFISRAALSTDIDCIIMGYSQFEKIPMSKERLIAFQKEKLATLLAAMESVNQGERMTLKKMEVMKANLEVKLEQLQEQEQDNVVTFEELGVDALFVDEAHNYKNLALFSRLNVSGVTSGGAKKCFDMEVKCAYLNERNAYRNIVFATGTPISNTMCELFVMQKYLRFDRLKEYGLSYFDQWAANYGEMVTALELAVDGTFQVKTRFSRFRNIPELLTMFHEFADVRMKDSLNLDVPKLKGGKPIVVESEPDDFTKEIMESFVARAERIHSGAVDPSEDNFLKITMEARLLGTDARLLYEDAPVNPDGKLFKVARDVLRLYEECNRDGKIGCILIFSDIGVPNPNKSFTVYGEVKRLLLEGGIPEEQIAFVHDATTDVKRRELFRSVWEGRVRVLLGSTDKCGTGVNIQRYCKACLHIDAPWKPSSIEQRDGRIVRQYNTYPEVSIYRYCTKGTFDAYNWGILETKAKFIAQVMSSDALGRTCEDLDEATLSYGEIKAIATGNPLIKRRMEVEAELQKIRILRKAFHDEQMTTKYNLDKKYPELKSTLETLIAAYKDDIPAIAIPEEFELVLADGTKLEGIKEGCGYIAEQLKDLKISQGAKEVGMYAGFHVLIEKILLIESIQERLILKRTTTYETDCLRSAEGIHTRLDQLLGSIPERLEKKEHALLQLQSDVANAKDLLNRTFSREEEYAELKREKDELDVMLSVKVTAADSIAM